MRVAKLLGRRIDQVVIELDFLVVGVFFRGQTVQEVLPESVQVTPKERGLHRVTGSELLIFQRADDQLLERDGFGVSH